MSDLLWDDVKCFFDLDLMGSLPDVRVPDASVEDWQTVLHLVAERGWKYQYSEGETVLPVPRAETGYLLSQGIDVIEAPVLGRSAHRRRSKSDRGDAEAAARAVLSGRACTPAKGEAVLSRSRACTSWRRTPR